MADSPGERGERACFFTNFPEWSWQQEAFLQSHTDAGPFGQTCPPVDCQSRQPTHPADNTSTTRRCLPVARSAIVISKHQRAARPRPPSSQACTCNTPQRPPGGGNVAKEGRQPPPIHETPHLTQPKLLTAKPFFLAGTLRAVFVRHFPRVPQRFLFQHGCGRSDLQ